MNKKYLKKRVIASVMALAMAFSLLPVNTVSATEGEEVSVETVEETVVTEETVTEETVAEETVTEETVVSEETDKEQTASEGKIAVWDFGAEQLDSSVYDNKLNADVINSWYADVPAGTTGKNLASFSVNDGEFVFNDGGYPTTHRLRSTNEAITRYDAKSLKDSAGNVFTGYIYSNKAKTADVYVGLECEANDTVTVWVASNGTDSTVVFENTNDASDAQEYTHTLGSSTVSAFTYYAANDSFYKLYSSTEKLVVARVTREHAKDVAVSGLVAAPAELAEYSLIFTNEKTGKQVVAPVANGTYEAVLAEGFSYQVSLANANGYVITSAQEITPDSDEMVFDVTVEAVTLATVSGELMGLSEEAANELSLSFVSSNVFVPSVEITGTSFTATVETNVEYTVEIAGIDDYQLVSPETINVSEDSVIDITFDKKPVYKVTIAPTGASLSDLAEAVFTFTRHSDADVTAEEGYVYTFTGTDEIALRDGVYTVKVTNSGDYKQKLTSNLKVAGAAVTKTIGFDFTGDPTQPKSWSFTSDEYTGQASYDGLTIVNGAKHSSSYGMMIKNGYIEIPVSGSCTIKVGVGYTWDLSLEGTEQSFVQTSDGGYQSITFDYAGEAGSVKILAGLNATSYVNSVVMTPVSDTPVVYPASWDFRADSYTGQTDYNGLEITNGKKHGASYGMQITNGSIKVPVSGACTLKVSVGYNWDITIDGFQGDNYKDKTNSGDKTLEYEYKGAAGVVEISTGAEFTSYIKSIEVVYPVSGEAQDIVVTVGATGCDYTTINDALTAVRKMTREAGQRAVIMIQPGDYEEMLVIDVPNVSLVNASATPSIELKNKGVDIDENAVRITSYYGHGYTYYSMGTDCKYNEEILAVNKENGYPSFENPGSGTTNGSYWNATVVISADGFKAEGIIFENSFNQYVSKKAANDVIVAQSSAKEGSTPRAKLPVGSTEVQNKKYVERAAALAIYNNVKETFFDNCKFIGRQDTLYGGTDTTAAFYNCSVYGGTDYIFGGMNAVFAKCDLVANTMEDNNDTFYITAAQQKSGRGMLFYNCHVTSTVPGVDTASQYPSKAGYFGRPWQANTGEAVFFDTVVDSLNSHWSETAASMIAPAGWLNTLSGESALSAEYGTFEKSGVNNQAARAAWATTATTPVLADGTAITVENFLGTWDAFAGKDMEVIFPDGIDTPDPVIPDEPVIDTPVSETAEFVFEAKDLTAFAQGTKADGDEEKAGTENYFTLLYSAKSKVDSSSKTFEDDYASSQRVNFGGKATTAMNAMKFTTSNKATVKVWWVEGGDDNRQMAILNASGEQVAVTDVTAAKNACVISTLTLEEAGTYYLGGATNNNYIFKVVVTEEKAQEAVVNTYVLDATADLEAMAAGAKADGDEGKAGTADFFTIIYSAKTKIDASNKTFEDDYTASQRINLGGAASTAKNAVKFTTQGSSVVKVWWVEGGDDNRQMAILDASGNQVAVTDVTVAKNAAVISSFELANAGTYYLGGATNNNYIFKIEVVDTVGGTVVKPARADWNSVAAPEISVAANADGTVTATVNAVVGYNGADKVTAMMFNAAGEKVEEHSSSAEKDTHTLIFAPKASGVYTFVAVAVRDEEADKEGKSVDISYVLPLAAPVIKSATSTGNGTATVEWNAVDEADGYIVKAGEQTVTTSELFAVVSNLHVGETYTVTVAAVRGEEVSKSSSIEVTITAEAQRTWAFARYGSSIDTKNNGFKGNALDGQVTVYSESGKGKIVPGSTDGLAFYYTVIDPETENFTLTANVHVDNWTLSNGQEGFGLMAADTVGKDGDGTAFWNNSYQLLASKIEYYHDGEGITTDTSANKISMKLGLGYTAKLGVTAEDVAAIKKGEITMPAGFTTETGSLETSCASLGSGTYNLVGNYVGVEPTGCVDNLVTDFVLQIQRNNTGYILRYLDMEGNVIEEKLYYDLDRNSLTQIDAEHIYLGFFASRNARITVTNIDLTTINPADDEAAQEREIEYVYPSYTIESATNANAEDYSVVYYGNADGVLTIVDNNGTVVADGVHVLANTKNAFGTKLALGETTFTVTFTPDADFVPGEFKKLTSYETATFTHTVLYKAISGKNIYVSQNGTSEGNGTKENPVDIYTAVKYAQAGQVIILAGGTYNLSRTIKVERGINGTADHMIYMIADPDATERPVFDFGGRCAGTIFAGDYWYFYGFDVTRSADAQKGIQVSGDHNVLDSLHTYKNGNTGLQVSRYLGTDNYEDWPSYNLILNCTSYLNADKGYEDADGFAAKLTVADGNVFDGCIAAYNADDGWDLFAKVQSGSIGSVTIKNSVTFMNGYVLKNDAGELDINGTHLVNAGNGNGFKMGGDSMSGYHKLINSVAFNNKAKGFDSNSCPDIQVYNSTSFDNESYNVAFYTNTAVNTDFFADGILSYKKSNSTAEQKKLLGTQDESKVNGTTNYYFDGSVSKNSEGVTVSDDWFVSLDTSVAMSILTERNADGTINMHGLLELTDKAPAGVGARMSGSASLDDSDMKEEPVEESKDQVVIAEDGTMKVVIDGEVVEKEGVYEVNGEYYYVNNEGNVQTETKYISKKFLEGTGLEAGYYHFNLDGSMVVSTGVVNFEENYDENGKIEYSEKRYYIENGLVQKNAGLVEADGKLYVVNWDGSVYMGDRFFTVKANAEYGIAAGKYFFNSLGEMYVGQGVECKKFNDAKYLLENGRLLENVGLVLIGTDYYYAQYDGKAVINKTYQVSKYYNVAQGTITGKHHFGEDGKMDVSSNELQIGGAGNEEQNPSKEEPAEDIPVEEQPEVEDNLTIKISDDKTNDVIEPEVQHSVTLDEELLKETEKYVNKAVDAVSVLLGKKISGKTAASSVCDFSSLKTDYGYTAGVKSVLTATETNSTEKTLCIYTSEWKYMTREMASDFCYSGKELEWFFDHNGFTYKVTIPAGADIVGLMKEIEFAGPLYIGSKLGKVEVVF